MPTTRSFTYVQGLIVTAAAAVVVVVIVVVVVVVGGGGSISKLTPLSLDVFGVLSLIRPLRTPMRR